MPRILKLSEKELMEIIKDRLASHPSLNAVSSMPVSDEVEPVIDSQPSIDIQPEPEIAEVAAPKQHDKILNFRMSYKEMHFLEDVLDKVGADNDKEKQIIVSLLKRLKHKLINN